VPTESVGLEELDAGDRAAIRLAEQLGAAAFLLMDDAKGRGEASRRGIPSTGTLGVLQAASKGGHLLLRKVLPLLLQTNFYVSQALVDSLIAEESTRLGLGG
jgi:predicted nucleic acid-binding protein